jgi:hypothetical protein
MCQCFFLQDLEVERSSFYKLTVKETARWRRATTVRLDRSSTTVEAASSGASTPRSASMAAAQAGAPPLSPELAWEALARWIY